MLKTEFEFRLPKGYVDGEGNLHTDGVMRLATAADELLPMKDPRVRQNEAYLSVILLSRVVTRLGNLSMITPMVIEGLFAADFAYLQDLYQRINASGDDTLSVTCPKCEHGFEVAGGPPMGES
jgi:hypothetical protein